jgi:hypothetical protein
VFDPTKEVPSLELCKRLKELGFPQNSPGWYWRKVFKNPNSANFEWKLVLELDEDPVLVVSDIKAPTCRELGEWLPEYIKRLGDLIMEKRYNGGWIVRYEEYDDIKDEKYCSVERIADTEPNARAEMLIWLRENGYTKFEVIE